MKQREKRNIIIGILCCMVVFMGVGYAVLSQTLKINGTANITGSWNIYIESITFNESESNSTTRGTGSVDQTDKTKATYSAELLKPQDVVVYDVVVANAGTIDAVLNDLVIDPTDTEYFSFETIGIAKGDELPAQTGDNPTTRSFKIKVTFKDTVTEANMPPAGTQVEGLVKLDYVQKTTTNFGTESVPGGDGNIPSDEPAITVDSNGLVTSYNKEKLTNSEGYVVIPATTEKGEEIISIDSGSFVKYNVAQAYVYNETTSEELQPYVIYDEDNYNEIKDILLKMNDSSESGSGSYSSNSFVLGEDINPVNMINKKNDAELIKKLSGSGDSNSLPIYSKSEFDELLKEMQTTGTLETEYMYGYVNIETGEISAAVSEIEKLDLTNAIYLKTIGNYAFMSNPVLKEVKLSDSIETIGARAFYECSLQKIEFGSRLKIIKREAFVECGIQGKIIIPASVTTIEREAFYGNSITSVIFEDTNDKISQLTTIGSDAFYDNELNEEIIIPSNITSIGDTVFDENSNLVRIIIKKANDEDLELGSSWNGTAEIKYDPNYVG